MELLALTHVSVDYENPRLYHQSRFIVLFPLIRPSWLGLAALTLSLSLIMTAPGAIALVRRGDTGEEVTALQTALRDAGYPVMVVDGIFGAGTENALISFQTEYGLVADGIAGDLTLAKLEEVNAGEAGTSGGGMLTLGASGEAVTQLQSRLKDLGFFPSSTDTSDYYGPVTASAVEAFQRANGLTADGIAGPATQARLFNRAPASGTNTESDTAEASTPLLTLGDSGEAVVALQDALKELGYFPTTIESTGNYGPLTVEAVREFQEANSLTADGIAGPVTQARVSSDNAIANTDTEDETVADSTSGATGGGGLLARESRGEAVTALQRRLTALGYFSAEATGFYGSITVEAVEAFQRANSLTVDGVAGPRTQAALFSDNAIAAPTETASTTPATETSSGAATGGNTNTTNSTLDSSAIGPGTRVTIRTSGSALNVRSAPNTISSVVKRTLADGTSVEATGVTTQEWIEIVPDGWISKEFIEIQG